MRHHQMHGEAGRPRMSVYRDAKLVPKDVVMISFFCYAYDIRQEREPAVLRALTLLLILGEKHSH
jgi:hypothetical protein